MKQTIQIADKPTLDEVKHMLWLSDYKTYGEDSYVFNDKSKLHELYEDYELSLKDLKIVTEAFDYLSKRGINIADIIKIIDPEFTASTFDEMISNEETVRNMLMNQTIMSCVALSEIAMSAIVSNNDTMNYLYNASAAYENGGNIYNPGLDKFMESPHLLSACEKSAQYEVIERDAYLVESKEFYNNRCLILGFKQGAERDPSRLTSISYTSSTGNMTSDSFKASDVYYHEGLYRYVKFASSHVILRVSNAGSCDTSIYYKTKVVILKIN